MYAVSNAYKAQMRKNVQQRKLRGTINEVVAFTDDDILQGSFTLTNQCMDTSSFGYGGVYVAELHLTFISERVYDRKNWKGKRLFIEDGLFIDSEDDYEYIPLGHFLVAEANYTVWGLEIKAYDYMTKFDQDFTGVQTHGKPYGLASLACVTCGVPMAQTEEEFNLVAALPDNELKVTDGIETWRDYLSFLCQACNMYCTMERDGSLSFRKIMPATNSLVDTPTDEIGLDRRFDDGVVSDFTTSYTGIKATFASEEETTEEVYGNTKGVVVDIGVNPFLQQISDQSVSDMIDKLNADISSTETAIEDIDDEIDALDVQIAYVEEQIEQHPDDKELPKLLDQLQKNKVSKEAEKRHLESYLDSLQTSLEEIEDGIAAQTMTVMGARLQLLATDLQSIQYTPGTISMLGDPAYDLGDVLRLSGGIVGGVCDFNIMRYDYTFGSKYTVETFGENPKSNDSKSKESKSASTKDAAEKSTTIEFVKYVNASAYDLGIQETEIAFLHFGMKKNREVETWTELKFSASNPAQLILKYYLDNELVAEVTPEENWGGEFGFNVYVEDTTLCFSRITVGPTQTHTENFHYHITELPAGSAHTWRVTATVPTGNIVIPVGGVHTVLWAQGMIGDRGFDGYIVAKDAIPFLPFGTLDLFGDLEEEVEVTIGSGPVPEDYNILTESGDTITDESGDELTTINLEDLPDADPLDGTEYVPIVQNGVTVKITTQDIAEA